MNFHFYGGYYLPVSVPRRTSAFLMAWREPAQSKADAFPSKVRIENPCAKSCEQPTLEICQEICTHLWNLLTLHPDIFLQLATPPLFPRQVVISIRMPYHHYCYLFFSVQCFLLFFFFWTRFLVFVWTDLCPPTGRSIPLKMVQCRHGLSSHRDLKEFPLLPTNLEFKFQARISEQFIRSS